MVQDNIVPYGSAPHVAISGSNAVVVWAHQDGFSQNICSSYSTDGGENWSATQTIESLPDATHSPQVAMSGSNVVAVWVQYDNSSPIHNRIHSNYSTDGGATWGVDSLLDVTADHAGLSQVAVSGYNAVAVWQQYDGNPYRIYSNHAILQIDTDGDGMPDW